MHEHEATLIEEELRVAHAELEQQNVELEHTRAAIEDERERYRILFDLAPDAYLVTDAAGMIWEANRAAEEFLGVPRDRLPRRPLVNFVAPETRRTVRRWLAGASERPPGDVAELSFTVRGGHGPSIPVVARVAAARGSAGVNSLRWVLRDVSAQVAAEERLAAANAALEERVEERTRQLAGSLARERRAHTAMREFLIQLSHELRAPLHAMIAYTDVLGQQIAGSVTDEQRRILDRMHRGEEHMARLVERILDHARAESGQLVLDVRAVGVHDAACHATEMFAAESERSGPAVAEPVGPRDTRVRADPDALRQILINLVGNAVKYAPSGTTVRLAWTETEDEAAITVSDEGPGIPRDRLLEIFEPFVQLPEHARERRGTGLGLAISRSLAAAMGGGLDATSAVGRGTTFTLRLPLVAPEDG